MEFSRAMSSMSKVVHVAIQVALQDWNTGSILVFNHSLRILLYRGRRRCQNLSSIIMVSLENQIIEAFVDDQFDSVWLSVCSEAILDEKQTDRSKERHDETSWNERSLKK